MFALFLIRNNMFVNLINNAAANVAALFIKLIVYTKVKPKRICLFYLL